MIQRSSCTTAIASAPASAPAKAAAISAATAAAAAIAAIAASLTLNGSALAASIDTIPSSCLKTTVAKREFGQVVRHVDMLAIDPRNQLGKQVFIGLDNGLKLELDEDSSDVTFFGNYAIGHRVEICAIHGATPGATARAVSRVSARATAGSSQAKLPIPRLGAAPGLAFSIADRVTGTYVQAQLTSHVFSAI
jgi:hypothetical protein